MRHPEHTDEYRVGQMGHSLSCECQNEHQPKDSDSHPANILYLDHPGSAQTQHRTCDKYICEQYPSNQDMIVLFHTIRQLSPNLDFIACYWRVIVQPRLATTMQLDTIQMISYNRQAISPFCHAYVRPPFLIQRWLMPTATRNRIAQTLWCFVNTVDGIIRRILC